MATPLHTATSLLLNLVVRKLNTLVNRALQGCDGLLQTLLLVIIKLTKVVDVLGTCVGAFSGALSV